MEKIMIAHLNRNPQEGQTLIETLVAVFILVMGITAAVGLAIFAYSNSTNISKQIIATGLAREGLEAFKNMRDTNWLQLTVDRDCYNFSSIPIGSTSPAATVCPGGPTGGVCCYKRWLDPPGSPSPSNGYYLMNPGAGEQNYRLRFDPDTEEYWQAKVDNSGNNWGLDFNGNSTSSSFTGFYTVSNINLGIDHGSSGYYRKITIEPIRTAPFDIDGVGPKLRVISRVWWTDKKCPRVARWEDTNGKCVIQLETQLTNWKNY